MAPLKRPAMARRAKTIRCMLADYNRGARRFPMALLARVMYLVLGLTSVGLAALGAVLPGLPTTVFLLVALWAFSRSSDRLHGWVTRMPLFREALVHVERYHAERTISRGVKLVAVSCAWASVALFFVSRGLEPSVTG